MSAAQLNPQTPHILVNTPPTHTQTKTRARTRAHAHTHTHTHTHTHAHTHLSPMFFKRRLHSLIHHFQMPLPAFTLSILLCHQRHLMSFRRTCTHGRHPLLHIKRLPLATNRCSILPENPRKPSFRTLPIVPIFCDLPHKSAALGVGFGSAGSLLDC